MAAAYWRSRAWIAASSPSRSPAYASPRHSNQDVPGARSAGGGGFGASRFLTGSPRVSFSRRYASSVSLRSEEHTSELQSHSEIVCRLVLDKKNKQITP